MKEYFLRTLREQMRQDALKDITTGKLRSPADLDEICGRLTPKLRNDSLTGDVLKALDVTDDDLRSVYRSVLQEVGIEVVNG